MQSKILTVAVLAFLAVGTACKSAAVGDNPAANANSTEAAKGTGTSSADPKASLVSSMRALRDAPQWIADVDTTNDMAPQAEVKMQIRYQAPDNFQIENNAGGAKMQIVATGGKTYQQTGGKWQEAPPTVNAGQMLTNLRDMFSDQRLDAFKNIELVGKETVGGRELAIYTYEIDQAKAMPEAMKKDMTDEDKARLAEVQAENRAKIWLDAEKNLPAKLELTMKMTKPQQMSQKMTVNYRYDEPVIIEAPKLK